MPFEHTFPILHMNRAHYGMPILSHITSMSSNMRRKPYLPKTQHTRDMRWVMLFSQCFFVEYT